jgi:predicted transcriptional regulator of viral defense system
MQPNPRDVAHCGQRQVAGAGRADLDLHAPRACLWHRLGAVTVEPADLFRLHCGIMRMADILRGGINRNTLYAMRDAGLVVQLARGLYRLAEMAPLSQADLVTVAAKATQAVIYLVSALSFHELTTQIPHEVWIAIARNSEPPRLDYPPIRISRLTDVAFKTGIEKHAVDGKTVSVYSREKTLADRFSRRNEVGLDVAIEALKSYMEQDKVKVVLIMEYATKLRVAKTMRPYLEALL